MPNPTDPFGLLCSILALAFSAALVYGLLLGLQVLLRVKRDLDDRE